MTSLSAPTTEKIGFNPNIQGLRGIAAASVFIFHIYDMSRKLDVIPETMPIALKAILLSLSSGVDLFFMISGYLITASLIRHKNVQIFLIDRAIRIYPVFLFLHVCLFALAPIIKYKWLASISVQAWMISFFSNLLLLPGIFDLPLMQLNAWSLSYEALFYLLSAGIYTLWTRKKIALRTILLMFIPILIIIYPRAIFFAVGTLCFFTFHRKPPLRAFANWLNKFSAGIYAMPLFFSVMGAALLSGYKYAIWLTVPIGFMLFMGLLQSKPSLSCLLQNRVALFIGQISYSFYLWHPVVTFPLKHLMISWLINRLHMSWIAAVMIFGLIAALITIPVSYMSWYFLEQKCGVWLRCKWHHGNRLSRQHVI